MAEKFEAMVKLGMANSRMKDFYDLWVMARQFEFRGLVLSAAIKATLNDGGQLCLYQAAGVDSRVW